MVSWPSNFYRICETIIDLVLMPNLFQAHEVTDVI